MDIEARLTDEDFLWAWQRMAESGLLLDARLGRQIEFMVPPGEYARILKSSERVARDAGGAWVCGHRLRETHDVSLFQGMAKPLLVTIKIIEPFINSAADEVAAENTN